jgi:small subunit ribosomal protein S6
MAERKKKTSAQPAEMQARTSRGETRQYEAMFLLAPGDAEAATNVARGIIERHAGTILVIKRWDERKLAYELGRQKRGLYILAYFTAPGTAVSAIERDVNLSEEVLRVLITDADHLSQPEMEAVEPQPIAPPREERAPWDRDRFDRGDRGDRGGDRFERRGPRRDEAASAEAKE